MCKNCFNLILILMIAALMTGCNDSAQRETARREEPLTESSRRTRPDQNPLEPLEVATPPASPPPMTTEQAPSLANLRDTDLVSLTDVDPTIVIENPLASADNPFHYRFFRENAAYMRYGTAIKVAEAQKDFRTRGLRLKIWTAYRPFPAQVKMFQIFSNPDWISDPYHESGKKTHVRAVAVDCTLIDESGRELEMPTPYLDFEHGHERMKQSYRNLPAKVLANRELLRRVMTAHGLEPYVGEWWHFQDTLWASYPVIASEEFPDVHQKILVSELLVLK